MIWVIYLIEIRLLTKLILKVNDSHLVRVTLKLLMTCLVKLIRVLIEIWVDLWIYEAGELIHSVWLLTHLNPLLLVISKFHLQVLELIIIKLVAHHLHVVKVWILIWFYLVRENAAENVFNVVLVVDKVPFLLLLVASLLVPFLLLGELLDLLHFHFIQELLHVSEVRVLDLKI